VSAPLGLGSERVIKGSTAWAATPTRQDGGSMREAVLRLPPDRCCIVLRMSCHYLREVIIEC
jgi:hypothetical protein